MTLVLVALWVQATIMSLGAVLPYRDPKPLTEGWQVVRRVLSLAFAASLVAAAEALRRGAQ